MKYSVLLFLLLLSLQLTAQEDTSKKITFSGYAEMYYSYDFNNPSNHEKDNFLYNHKRHNEINANLLLVKANYVDKNTRANLGLMLGNYAQYNLSAEPTWAQFIYEANIGVKLSKKQNIWLDAGIMPSHIGFESAISADCWTLTRSILAENSPYYEAGLKLSFLNKTENLSVAFLLLNGWQKISKPNYIQNPSFGMQINLKTSQSVTLNYSNFIGTDKPDSLNAVRTYHNFYVQYQPKTKLGLIAGFDIGTDKYNSNNYGIWWSPVVIVKYALSKQLKVALRGEYYSDSKQIIVSTNSTNGFQVLGISSNVDYSINNKIQFRIEGKTYQSKYPNFNNNEKSNYTFTTNMTIQL